MNRATWSTIFIAFICVVLMVSPAPAQTTHIVTIDKLKGTVTGLDVCPEPGDLLLIEVLNVNPFLYDVTIDAVPTSYNTTVPEAFKNVFMPAKETSNPGAAGGLSIANAGKRTRVVAAYNDLMQKLASARTSSDDILAGGEILVYNLRRQFIDRDAIILLVKNRIGTHIPADPASRADFIGFIQRQWDPVFDALTTLKNEMRDAFDDAGGTKKLEDDPTYNELLAFETRLREEFEERRKRGGDYGDLYGQLVALDPTIRVSKPVDKDRVTITVKGTPKGVSSSLLGTSHKEFSDVFPVETCGGIKLDFSTGFFLSGVVDSTFTLIDAVDTTGAEGKKIHPQNIPSASFGIGALMHLHGRSWPSRIAQLGLVIGSYTSNFENLIYVGGISVQLAQFGQRFSISGGASFGKAKGLGTGLALDTFIPKARLASNDVPTQDTYPWSWFVAITWNFP